MLAFIYLYTKGKGVSKLCLLGSAEDARMHGTSRKPQTQTQYTYIFTSEPGPTPRDQDGGVVLALSTYTHATNRCSQKTRAGQTDYDGPRATEW